MQHEIKGGIAERLVDALERLADAIEEANARETKRALALGPPPGWCPECETAPGGCAAGTCPGRPGPEREQPW